MNRAFVALDIKALDDDSRLIEGWASTGSVDRVGDIVVPKGAVYKLPLPFLLDHDHKLAVGEVDRVEITDKGIKFWAHIKKISEPGEVKDLCDKAWSLVKNGLRRAVSIGFSALEYDVLPNGGLKFNSWEWLELSAVTVPAQSEAVITGIKNLSPGEKITTVSLAGTSFDTNAPAATGTIERPVKTSPGASGKTVKSVNLRPKEGTNMKTIAEQIAALEASRNAKSARMGEVMQKSIDEGRSTDQAEQEEFDTLEGEVAAIDGDLKRLRVLEKAQALSAKPVVHNQIKSSEEGTAARSGITLAKPAPEKGIRFARYAKCLAISTKHSQPMDRVAEALYGKTDPDLVDIVKAAVPAMTSGNTDALIGNEGGFGDFVEFLRPMTIVGRFGTGNIPALTRVPFRVPLISETSETDAQWVGEGKGKPLTRFTVGRNEIAPLKIATIAVQTMELIRDSSPSSDVLLRNSLAKAIARRADLSFIDPTSAGVTGVRPASILNGVTPVTNSTATGADAVREDVQALIGAFVAANNPLQSGVWIMSATYALRLMMMLNPLGQREFPGITMQGGTFFELPVIVSNYLGDYVALVNAEDVYLADEGGVEIAMSTEASLEMVDNPTQDSGADTPVGAELVSMFQTNSVAFRAERTMNWMRRRVSAAAWIDNVTWGDPAAPATP